MKAVIYARVSSTDDSQSFDRQIDDLKRWAQYLKLDISAIFAEKISGFRKGLDERIEFNKMLDYIQDNNIKHIMVSELSRLSRRYIDIVNFIDDCTKKGIAIHIQKEGLSTLNENGVENPTVQMMTGMLSSMAQQESISLSHRIKSGKQFAASQGGCFSAKIYGYDKGSDGKPVINEGESILVKKMFELLLNGVGVRTIVNYLNENYETKEWKTGSVHSIVRNSFYCGKRKYNDSIIKVPAIVDEETFNAAQKFIDERKRFAGRIGVHVNPFASFIKCKCGATMNQIIIKSNNINIYRCSKKCDTKSVNRPFLIQEVRNVLESNASLSKDELVRSDLKQKIDTNNANLTTHLKRKRALKIMSEKNYERLLSSKIDDVKYDAFERKFEYELSQIEIDMKDLYETNRALQNSLDNEIIHYSDNHDIFKSQLLKILEWIEIGDDFAVVKIKGWAKAMIPIYRGHQLFAYKKSLKENNGQNKYTTLDWDNLPFEDHADTEELNEGVYPKVRRIKKIIRENGVKTYQYWDE
ncbi:recombinase family protein [Ancylomarina euxinus]|uniref:Recombinase family protein n=1 Tax=Ancylomarina euxinus TaxID=2283627 RepID=A0A425Y8K8_9BACT|nr:recombinase family protein [Ancylomarina euxinus]MCZ4693307.1 recombinase family protein [Ancylomarina euxinus]MUP13535.1 hypothetical protein [Ancylomarina euxinus]RRG24816.1 recombinase family protein [Ancylomarina euxinus]